MSFCAVYNIFHSENFKLAVNDTSRHIGHSRSNPAKT